MHFVRLPLFTFSSYAASLLRSVPLPHALPPCPMPCTQLGLGDVVLPGLLVSFALRVDVLKGFGWRRGYFAYMVLGYALGLALAIVASVVMRMGQPALLYLVPCTLWPCLLLATWRGEVLMSLVCGPVSCLWPRLLFVGPSLVLFLAPSLVRGPVCCFIVRGPGSCLWNCLLFVALSLVS